MSVSLADLLDESPDEIEVLLESCVPMTDVAPDERFSVVRPQCDRLRALFRALGITRLLANGDTEGFYHELMRSGHTRLYFLTRCKAEGCHLPEAAAGRIEGLSDALAAGALDLATNIAEASPRDWWEDDEYEDDFTYAHFLHKLLLGADRKAELEPILSRFERAAEGEPTPRLEVCRALATRDQESFDQAFASLIVAREAEIEAAKERFELETETVITDRSIFVEGLSLLRLAERNGIATKAEYLFCPSLARLAVGKALPPGGYPTL